MHIAIIAADLLPDRLGGAEIHVVEVIRRLAEKGHTFDLFVGASPEIAGTFPKNVKTYTVSYPRIPNLYGLSYIVFSYHQIKRILSSGKFEIIWAKQVFPQGIVAVMLAEHFRKPLYVTAQNPLAYKEELVLKGPIPFKKSLPTLLAPLIRFALSHATIVACVSEYSSREARRLGAKKTVVIPNGVDVKKFKTQNATPKGGQAKRKTKLKTTIVTTSALIPRNGLDTLIDAVAQLPKSLDWELVIAGEGPEEKKLKAQSSKLKVSEKVRFLGRVENRKVPELLASADLFVRLSRKEGFGVSFLEAMAAGIPIIATPVGGITDFVTGGKTGMLVKPDAPREAAKAMEKLLTDHRLASQLTKNARKLMEERYSWEKVADEVDQVFHSLA